MSAKRSLAAISPDHFNRTNKRQQKITTIEAMAVGQMSIEDLKNFMGDLLDKKNANLATKEDVATIHTEIQKLRTRNLELTEELDKVKQQCETLKREVEFVTRKSCEKNLIVRLINQPNTDPRDEAKKLLSALVSEEPAPISSIRVLPSNSQTSNVVVETNSKDYVDKILHNTIKLKGTGIFIHRDLPREQRRVRQSLLRVRKAIKNCTTNVEVKIRGDTLVVAGKIFSWSRQRGLLQANDGNDGCEILHRLYTGFKLSNRELLQSAKNMDNIIRDNNHIMAKNIQQSKSMQQNTSMVRA